MIFRARPLGGLLLVAADLAVLVLFVPDGPALAHHLATADAWVAAVGADTAATSIAGAALWLCAVWLGLALALIALASAPGWLGATGRRLTHLVVPVAAVRAIAGIAGLSISFAAIAPAAALAQPTPPGPSASSAPAWPTSPTPPTPAGTIRTLPSVPSWPISAPLPRPGSPAAGHRVAPGDCLWDLAADQLGPAARPDQITAQTQAWYAANRTVIGPDPALLHPGQLLVEPERSS
jgi:resuscitation-promoting factor RpfA